jgi:hypothetical protein
MAKHTIDIETRSSDYWIRLIQKNRRSEVKKDVDELVINFAPTRFLHPSHIVALACLIEEYVISGAKVTFTGEPTYVVDKYLKNIRFLEYWNPGFNRNKFTRTHIETTLCLWKVRNDMISSYATEAQKYFQNNFFAGKNLESLYLSLTEVFNNIFDHSRSPVDGYVLTQYYPNINKIITSVCDFGVGIPAKINQIWKESKRQELSDEDALRAAFFRHITSKSVPANRGFGLATLFGIITKLQGELTVVSNMGVLERHPGGSITIHPPNIFFHGTLIIITLDARYLPDIEAQVEDEEFIF